MAPVLNATIAGVNIAPYLEGLDITPARGRKIGLGTLHLSKQSGGLTIADKAEVKVWRTDASVITRRYIGGFVQRPQTSDEGLDKLWTVQVQDYNLLLDTMVADATYLNRVRDNGTINFEDQVDYILRAITRNDLTIAGTININSSITGSMGGDAPTAAFSGGGGTGAAGRVEVSGGAVVGVTITSAGHDYTSAPTVTISGGTGSGAAGTAVVGSGQVTSVTITAGGTGYYVAGFEHQGVTLRAILEDRCRAYHAKYPSIKPTFAVSAGTTGPLAPQLEIWDAALAPSPVYHYTDGTLSAGTDRHWIMGTYSRAPDGSRTCTEVQAKAMLGTGPSASLAVATARSDVSNRAAHPNPYDQRLYAGVAARAWRDVVIDAPGAKSGADVQAAADTYLAAREFARDTIEFDVEEELSPGDVVTHTNSLEGISAVNYRIAQQKYDFSEWPIVTTSRLTLGAVPLEIGEGQDDDVLPPPVERDRVPPEPPTSLSEFSNRYSWEHQRSYVVVRATVSASRDADFYTAFVTQTTGQRWVIKGIRATPGSSTFDTPPLEMMAGDDYTIAFTCTDTTGNEGAASAPLTGRAAPRLPVPVLENADFSTRSIFDSTKPEIWSEDTAVNGGVGTIATGTVTPKVPQVLQVVALAHSLPLANNVWRSNKVRAVSADITLGTQFQLSARSIFYATAAAGTIQVAIEHYDITNAIIRTDYLFNATPGANTLYTKTRTVTCPTNTMYARLMLRVLGDTVTTQTVNFGPCDLGPANVTSASAAGLLATTDTTGQLAVPTVNGTPIGVPDLAAGSAALEIDVTPGAERVAVYVNGVWKYARLGPGPNGYFSPLTNGSTSSPDLIYISGDVIMVPG